jgi:hypothetical protein
MYVLLFHVFRLTDLISNQQSVYRKGREGTGIWYLVLVFGFARIKHRLG